ncbi:hypothetical protein Blue_194 [Bacillus phage Deep Blue]|uniref:Uncharacterized protein n=1 Tax=Bacillus phage Deep Blue TaxID=1792245 RepID=A0A140HM04_9CAUD|nr:hypothetical protein Blue_194 [Bacillus phage Deep Blue]AMO26016.1 hypothetical protein Blue_194 [Bacillus phage Deep Blue]
MSIVLTERMAILKKMEYLEKERASLLASYDSCLDRLRELDDIDRMSAEAHSPNIEKEVQVIKEVKVEYPKFTKEDAKKIAEEIQELMDKKKEEPKPEIEMTSEQLKETLLNREQAEDLALLKHVTGAELKITDESIETVKVDNTDYVSDVPVHKEGQTLQEYFEENKDILEETVEVKEDKPEPKIETVGTDHKNLQMKPALMRGTTNDNQVVSQFAKVILKDYGIPIKAKLLLEKLREAGVVMKSPYETLKQIRNWEPGIQKAGHGYYQYVSVHTKSL